MKIPVGEKMTRQVVFNELDSADPGNMRFHLDFDLGCIPYKAYEFVSPLREDDEQLASMDVEARAIVRNIMAYDWVIVLNIFGHAREIIIRRPVLMDCDEAYYGIAAAITSATNGDVEVVYN